jgi:hypothetical protein
MEGRARRREAEEGAIDLPWNYVVLKFNVYNNNIVSTTKWVV